MVDQEFTKRLTDRYRQYLLEMPESNLYKAFFQTWEELKIQAELHGYNLTPFRLGEEARKTFDGVGFLDLGVDPERAEEDLLKFTHSFLDWTYLAEVFLETQDD